MNRAFTEPMGGLIGFSLKLIACGVCYVTFGVNSGKLLQWTCCTDGWIEKRVLRGGATEREEKENTSKIQILFENDPFLTHTSGVWTPVGKQQAVIGKDADTSYM